MPTLEKDDMDILKSIEELKLSGEISDESESHEYEILNATLMHGLRDVADYLLDNNYKVNPPTELSTPANTPLHHAVKLNDVQLMKKLLDRGASISATDPGKNTPLHLAFLLGHNEAADAIMSHMRDTSTYDNLKNKHDLSYLHVASARGNAFVTRKLIELGAKANEFVSEDSPVYSGYTALRFACTYRKLETMKVLREALNLHGTATDKDADNNVAYDNPELLKNLTRFLVNFQQNEDPSSRVPDFHLACFKDNSSVVADLLKENAGDIDAVVGRDSRVCPSFTPLHMAIEGEAEWKSEKVKLLLERGARVDLRNGFCMTALHLAAYNHRGESEDEALRLIYAAATNKQANPVDCNGLAYLHLAVAMNDFQLVKKLLNRGGEDVDRQVLPNLRRYSAYAPLHFAVRFGHESMANLLVKRGANVNANEEDSRFDTPLQLAIKLGHHRVMDLLLRSKANARVVERKGRKTTLHLLAERFGETSIATSAGLEEKGELQDFAYKLVRLGVDVDAADEEGSTALHVACSTMYDSIHLVNWLLMLGADVDAKNEDDETSLDVACRSGFRGNYSDFLMLYLHVQKLKDLGLKVDERNEKFCRLVMKRKEQWASNDDWRAVERMFSAKELNRKKQGRQREIQKLKGDMIADGVSLYDYVRMDAERAAAFVGNEKVEKIVDKDDWDDYEVYGYLIPAVYRRSLKWLGSRDA